MKLPQGFKFEPCAADLATWAIRLPSPSFEVPADEGRGDSQGLAPSSQGIVSKK